MRRVWEIVQNGKPKKIIASEQAENGKPRVRTNSGREIGYIGWTVDEVLRDVMCMESTLNRDLQYLLEEFYSYVNAEDYENARSRTMKSSWKKLEYIMPVFSGLDGTEFFIFQPRIPREATKQSTTGF